MNKSQISLLESFGIPYDVTDVEPEIKSPLILDGFDEEIYEFWNEWGPESELHPFALDYDQEQSYMRNIKKIHRYDRKERFRFTLYQLLGLSGTVPSQLCKIIRRFFGPKIRKSRIWNQIRGFLKQTKLRRYYNRIPQIISRCYGLKPTIPIQSIESVFKDFDMMHYSFNQKLRYTWKRKYFLNLRFVALKLLDKQGVVYPYNVPLVRTLRKKKYLNKLFVEFNLE